MSEVPIFQIDVCTSETFTGNPAAVCPLPKFLDDSLLQAVARENNLSETAFIVPSAAEDVDFDLRWFTPNKEVQLCGHATIAAAYVVLAFLEPEWRFVRFSAKTGHHTVHRKGGLFSLTLPLPEQTAEQMDEPEGIREAMGGQPIEKVLHTGDLYHLIYENRDMIKALDPDFSSLKGSSSYGFVASAVSDAGDQEDYVSRCFYPALDIEEDPVTLSAYLYSAPYWFDRLGKKALMSHQISKRGGQVWLSCADNHLTISGEATMIMQGSLFITGQH